jgi:hypothetical protein
MIEHTAGATGPVSSIVLSGRLLVAASIGFSLLIASMFASVAAAGFPAAEPITHHGIDSIAFWRSAAGWTFLVPIGLAAAASVILALVARPRAARIAWLTIVLGVLAFFASIVYAIAWQASLGFTTATILDDPARSFALSVFGRVAVPLIAIASAGAALCLRSVGTSRTAPLVVAAIAVAIAGAFALGVHEVAPVPPAILVAVWIPLGVSAIRAGNRARSTSTLPAAVSV